MNKITIIGTGVYALSMAYALSKNTENDITMWTESDKSLSYINENKESYPLLKNIKIPNTIKFTTSYEEAIKNTNNLFIMTSSQYFTSVINNIKPYLNNNINIIIGTKGLDHDNSKFLFEDLLSIYNTDRLGVISGGSIAQDIITNELIGITLASKNINLCKDIINLYKNTNIKINCTKDLISTSILGSIKAIYALGAGLFGSLYQSPSAKCLYFTEISKEITKLLEDLGGNKDSLIDFAGLGDLEVTTSTITSRNYKLGYLIGTKSNEVDEFKKNNTIEGLHLLIDYKRLLDSKNLHYKIIDSIYDIIINNKDINILINNLK